MFKKISNKINKILPIYFPKSRAYTDKLHLAIWNCGDCKRHGNLRYTLKDIRITLRKNNKPVLVIKKGEL